MILFPEIKRHESIIFLNFMWNQLFLFFFFFLRRAICVLSMLWRRSSVLSYLLLPASPWSVKPQKPLHCDPSNAQKIVLSLPKTFSTVNFCPIFPFLCFHHGFTSFLTSGLSCLPSTTWGRAHAGQWNFQPQQTPSLTNPHPIFSLVLSLRVEPSSSACAMERFHQSKDVEEGEDLDN